MLAEKKRLGRGLLSLIGSERNEVSMISIERIKSSPFQPRRRFDEEKLKELAASIKEKGVIEPVIVRLSEDGNYELICGERRLRASKIAGLEKIPAIVKNVSDKEAFEISLIENVQREDLSPVEFAIAFSKLVDMGYTHEDIAKKIGKSRVWVTNIIRVLNLPEDVRELVDKGKISLGHAKILCSIQNKSKVREIAKQIVERGMSVRELEILIKNMNGKFASKQSNRAAKREDTEKSRREGGKDKGQEKITIIGKQNNELEDVNDGFLRRIISELDNFLHTMGVNFSRDVYQNENEIEIRIFIKK